MADGFHLAPVVIGAAAAGAAIGIYQVWRTSRAPEPFGANELLFGLVLGTALAVPVAASHMVAAITSGWLFEGEANGARLLAFAMLSTLIYWVVINRIDRTVRVAGSGPTLAHVSDKLTLFAASLAIGLALILMR